MKRIILSFIMLLALTGMSAKPTLVSKQITSQKEIDGGGSGLFKAVAVSEKSLPYYVVYRPKELRPTSEREKRLPVLIWGNGGCSDTSVGYERMLVNVASQGYIVIAIGELQMAQGDRKEKQTPSGMMLDAVKWICGQVQDKKSDYYDCVDTTRIASAGHSCGGAQTLYSCGDAHFKTHLILNAGMGDMEMADASRASLASLHCPILYLTGGEKDMAYNNARLDYERISHVPVVYGDMPTAGHGGTYGDIGGGDFGRMVIAWLDWQLKGKDENKKIFLENDLRDFSGWIMKHKNFNRAN